MKATLGCIAVIALILALNISQSPIAKVTLHVVDENGANLSGVDADVTFLNPVQKTGSWGSSDTFSRSGKTDANGLFVAEERAGFEIHYGARAPDYYRSLGRFEFKTDKDGRYQPWNPVFDIVLRKIANPIPMYAKHVNLAVPDNNKPIGYDLAIGDWVPPYGKGKSVDISFAQALDQRSERDFDYSLKVTFPNPGDGIQVFVPIETSEFKSPRIAPEEGYQREWIQTRNVRPNSPGKWTRDEKRSYFVRVRTVMDGNGKIVTANYGKLYGDFLSFTYYLNPNQNSRNMEFDPRQNLFPDLRGSQRVQKP